MACVDSASGVPSELDPVRWGFQNPELTVHLFREPVGEWFCVDAETTLGPASCAVATSSVYDEQGLVARTSQALLTLPHRPPTRPVGTRQRGRAVLNARATGAEPS